MQICDLKLSEFLQVIKNLSFNSAARSAFHAGAVPLRKVNFLTFVLLYSAYNLYSEFFFYV